MDEAAGIFSEAEAAVSTDREARKWLMAGHSTACQGAREPPEKAGVLGGPEEEAKSLYLIKGVKGQSG